MIAILMRHGQADPVGNDAERRLSSRGRAQIEQQATRLAQQITVAGIIASPYVRAQMTAEIMADVLGCKIETSAHLLPQANITLLYEVFNTAGDLPVLYVGHNPLLTQVARDLDNHYDGGFDPGSCAAFRFDVAARDLGQCLWQLHP